MDVVLTLVCLGLTVYFFILIARIVLSYVPALPEPVQPAARFVRAATDPLLLPLRGVIPPVRIGSLALDLSPLILFFAISFVRGLLCT